MKEYIQGQRVALPAVLRYVNPDRQLARLEMPNGAGLELKFEELEAWETDAQNLLSQGTYEPRDTVQQAPPAVGD